ncbi:hypothetical protein C8Q70DRAFT_1016607 [Cubamyces menziesii]|uniref:EthD domain-containing protein n=1 Tax=Trametes cubensis TaxID=1111947 RepID=A0AAD7U0L6_9APHY|nr:hypothetical protein C8Q70DRAFT_1016607 [Cubamyces menziesii]KAJ8488911.1 hypothetical protein ONZ51_g3271 [Trametes cubensis]
MTPSQRFRMVVLVTPKAGVSQEEFSAYWKDKHAPLFLTLAISKRNLYKYEQFHVDPKLTALLGANSGWSASASALPKFGGVAVFEAESPEKVIEIFQDEEYLRVVAPDEGEFCDRAGLYILAGHYVTIYEV